MQTSPKSAIRKRAERITVQTSDKIDRIVTNRILALPIFAAIMFVVYYISIGTVGDWLTGFTNDTLFGEWICGNLRAWLESIGTAGWLTGLVVDGIVAGVGAVIGFVPQMLVLFLMLCILEDIGYMARVAFIMDRIFRKFGLSGKSFIPMLIGSGCGVPGVMASRTIEQDRDRKMTIMTTCFVPCGAKMPIIGLFAGAIFGGSGLVAASAYFHRRGGDYRIGYNPEKDPVPLQASAAPFVMELPGLPRAFMWATFSEARGSAAGASLRRAGTDHPPVLDRSLVPPGLRKRERRHRGRSLLVRNGSGTTTPRFSPPSAAALSRLSLLHLGFRRPGRAPVGNGSPASLPRKTWYTTFGVLYGHCRRGRRGRHLELLG